MFLLAALQPRYDCLGLFIAIKIISDHIWWYKVGNAFSVAQQGLLVQEKLSLLVRELVSVVIWRSCQRLRTWTTSPDTSRDIIYACWVGDEFDEVF